MNTQSIPINKVKLMLYLLLSGFILSQAYRTVGGILSVPLKSEFALNSDRLAGVIGSFHIAFGCLQLLIGILIDNFGIRKTIIFVSPFSVVGALLSAMAVSPAMLQWGQILIGFGCAPAFLVCIVLMARHFTGKQFSMMYAFALGSGSLGLIFTSTPTAWLVDHFGWRSCFYILAVLSFLTWLLIFFGVRNVDNALDSTSLNLRQKALLAVRSISGYKALLQIRETPGILSLVFVIYAAFLTLRGLWLGPLMVERYEVSLVFAGNLALVLSVISVFSPMLFGKFDPGPGKRYRYLCIEPWFLVVGFLFLAYSQHLWSSIAAIVVIAVAAANTVWQLADAKEVYPQDMQGRAIALFNTSLFLGASFMQWASGKAHDIFRFEGGDIFTSAFVMSALVLSVGIIAYTILRRPRQTG